jgi:predicted O-methyltransferase YrrM
MTRAADALTWLPSGSETSNWFGPVERFRVGETEFHCSFDHGSRVDRFFICKHRRLVEDYLAVFDDFPGANVVELGIMDGGSVALAALAATPRKLVALELDENRVAALDELIERAGLTERIRPYYGVDQADRARLGAVIDDEFAGQQLDLVIDDASHRLEETRASFETLFPRVRPGGLFLIEDWNWQHRMAMAAAATLADPNSRARAKLERRMREESTANPGTSDEAPATPAAEPADPPLSRLIIELVLAQAESDEFLSEVAVSPWWIGIRRGPGDLDHVSFRLSDLYTDHLGLLPG